MINPNLVRNIDRELGSRLCWILTQINKFSQKTAPPTKIRKILFIKVSEMGSTVLLYPTLKAARKYYPNAKIYFLTFKGNEQMLKILNIMPEENIFTIDIFSTMSLLFDLVKIIRKIRAEKIDVVIDCEMFHRFSAIIGFLVGRRVHVGFDAFRMEGLYRGDFFTHKVLYNHYQHTSLAFYTLLASLQVPEVQIPLLKKVASTDLSLPRFKPTSKEQESVWYKIHSQNPDVSHKSKLVLLNTHASDFLPLRRWSRENFINLGKKLLQDPQVVIILVGTDTEQTYIDEINKKINHHRCINLVGQTDLNELVTLCSMSHLLITNDSGPAHFAALTAVYIISLFGPETPFLYSPLSSRNISLSANLACSPCVNAYNARCSACRDNLCMTKIKVEDVFRIATNILSFPTPKPTDQTSVSAADLGLKFV